MRSHGRAFHPAVPVHRDEVLAPQHVCRRWWQARRGLIHKGLGGREFGLRNAISREPLGLSPRGLRRVIQELAGCERGHFGFRIEPD